MTGPPTALLVGTDAAAPAPTGERDVAALAELLRTRFGFAAEDVHTLTGSAATRAAILNRLDRLAAACRPGQRLVVYLTGHGALIPDPEDSWAAEAALEPYGATGRADLITDDQLYRWIDQAARRTDDVHVVVDSCFSGGLDSGDFEGRRPGPAYWGASGWPMDYRYALLASSRHSLTSATRTFAELGGATYSLLTGALVQLLAGWVGPLPTYAELRTLLDARTAALGSPQQPQVAGDVHREVFAGRRRPSRRYVLLAGPTTLRAGTAHGVLTGSRWALLSAGRVAAGPLGEVEVVDPTPLRSTCRPVGNLPTEPVADAVAVEVARPARPPGGPAVSGGPAVVSGHPPAVLDELTRSRWALGELGDLGAGAPPDLPAAVSIRLHHRRGGRGVFRPVPGPPGREPVLACGDLLAVEVRHAGSAPAYATLFHHGADGSVVRLWPRTAQNAPLRPGGTLRWGFHGSAAWRVDRPPAEPDLHRPAPRRQWVSVWLTSAEADLGIVEAMPSLAAAASPGPVPGGWAPPVPPATVVPPAAAAAPAPAPAPPAGAAGSAWWAVVRRSYLVAAPA